MYNLSAYYCDFKFECNFVYQQKLGRICFIKCRKKKEKVACVPICYIYKYIHSTLKSTCRSEKNSDCTCSQTGKKMFWPK